MEALHKQNKSLFNGKPDKTFNISKNYSNGLNSNKNNRISQTNLLEVCGSVKSAKQVIFFHTSEQTELSRNYALHGNCELISLGKAWVIFLDLWKGPFILIPMKSFIFIYCIREIRAGKTWGPSCLSLWFMHRRGSPRCPPYHHYDLRL